MNHPTIVILIRFIQKVLKVIDINRTQVSNNYVKNYYFNTAPDPIRPDPRVDPTRGQLCVRMPGC